MTAHAPWPILRRRRPSASRRVRAACSSARRWTRAATRVAAAMRHCCCEGRTRAIGPPRCAERLCLLHDEIIGALFEFARRHLYPSDNPSEAERMAVVATGGYGRGLLAPGSDIDLLFLLPYKQTAWGEQVAETILYCLWDMGLKVGHATRSVDECMRQAKADMTIRTAMLEARYLLGDRKLFDELIGALRQGGGAGHRGRSSSPPSSPSARSGTAAPGSRAIWSSPTSRTARAGLRDLHTLFWIAKYVYRVHEPEELIERGVFDRAEYQTVPPLRGFPLVGPLPHAFPRRPRRGAAVVRHPARDRGAARLHRASRPAGRRALHEALLPGRQGRRRPHRDRVRGAGGPAGEAGADAQPFRGPAAPKAGRRRPLPETEDFIVDNNRITIADADAFAARSGQPDPHLSLGAEAQACLPPRRHAARRAAR